MPILSTGTAADPQDNNPDFSTFNSTGHGESSGFPADYLSFHGGDLPNSPQCPGPTSNQANDPVMLELRVRTPTNARSFKMNINFFSAEYPEYACTEFNDFFVVLLDSTYTGDPANPADKNLATYTAPNSNVYPIGVNLAHGNTGLFRDCVNGESGCAGDVSGNITTCTGPAPLQGTGFDFAANGECDGNSLEGGATGWLVTAGNVIGGEVITLRIGIWDTSDNELDSLVLIDGFEWSVDTTAPGTDIE